MRQRYHRHITPWLLIAGAGLAGDRVEAQSLLDRSPNSSGAWVPPSGTVQFNLSHRFSRGPAPARKVTGFPSLLLSAGLPGRTTAGFVYTTNSTLISGYPNEWEFFARALPVRQGYGSPVDAAVQAGYNLAATGFAGEIALGRREGPLRLLGIARLLSPLDDTRGARGAIGGGLAFRLTSHVALSGDVVTLLSRTPGERAAWSAGLQLAIPNSPHTLSLHASNVPATTLHASSHGTRETRYGFEFTVPITLARYFGRSESTGSAATSAIASDSVTRIEIANLSFGRDTVEITAGTTVEWVNLDPLVHTVTARDGSFDSGLIEAGARWRRTFADPGTFPYACTPHPFMRGTIRVTATQ